MSALLARLGRVEWHATQLRLLKRGNGGHVRSVWASQTRQVSWWKRSYDGGMGSNEFGLGSQEDQKEEQEEHARDVGQRKGKGWGLDALEGEGLDRWLESKDKTGTTQPSDSEESGWSQGSEDAFWEAHSESVEEDAQAPSEESVRWKPDWGISEDERDDQSRSSSSMKLGWSQQSEDDFWESNSRPIDAFTDIEHESGTPSDNRWIPAHSGYEPGIPESPHMDVDYHADLPRALREGDQDLVARCLYAAEACRDYDFISKLSDDAFTELLHVIEPCRNIKEVANAYIKISEHTADQIGLSPVDQLMEEYGWMLQAIAAMRQRCGRRLTRDQYLILLRSASDLGEPDLALKLWESMQEDGVRPDLDMWNAYLAAHIRKNHHDSTPRHRERVINFHINARQKMRTDKPYRNYHIGERGIRQMSMAVLKAMLESDVRASEETYCLIMTAAAREGDIEVVKSVLRKVWDIDVTRLMELDEGDAEVPRPRELSRDSQFYPTSRLLGTLAYAFGINNSITTALRLVDYISREYDVTIDVDTWSTLFEWTFVLAQPRYGTSGHQDERTGRLPMASVSHLFNTLTGAPYHIEPTMNMLNLLIKMLRLQTAPVQMVQEMYMGLELTRKSLCARQRAWEDFDQCLYNRQMGRSHGSVALARRKWETATIIHATHHQMIKRWVRLLCSSLEPYSRTELKSRKARAGMWLRVLPRLLWEWRSFTFARVRYDLPTGIVEIELKAEEDKLRDAQKREAQWHGHLSALAMAPLVVGDRLIHTPMEEGAKRSRYTTKRLQKARNRGENW